MMCCSDARKICITVVKLERARFESEIFTTVTLTQMNNVLTMFLYKVKDNLYILQYSMQDKITGEQFEGY